MATSSTNKMPLLVDRPLFEIASLGEAAGLSSATHLNTPVGAGCKLLVDCSSGEGAVIDSLSVVITESSTTQATVLAFMSTATNAALITNANTMPVAAVAIPGGNTLGQRLNVSLPPLSVPVPNLASPAATMATYPTETDKKNTGLYVPSGMLLYVGLSAALTAPSAATRVIACAQGGYF